MKTCFNHPDKKAFSICHSCGKDFCEQCLNEGKEYYYCNSELCQSELKKELELSESAPGKNKKKWKYGWGWAILGSMLLRENKEFNIYFGENASLIQLFSFTIALTVYFLFRQKFLTKINRIWFRSLVAGIIALIVTIPLASVLGAFVNKPINKTVNDPNVTHILESKLKQQQDYFYEFAKEDKLLWSKFIDEPKTIKDINTNISLLDKLIPLYKEKDSILIATFTDISQALESSKEWKNGVPDLVSDFHSITEIGYSLSTQNHSYLSNLRNYYLSTINNDNQKDKYYNLYVKSFNESQKLTEKLNPILIRITGKNFNELQEENEKKYYNK